uniref:Uncharacterized protein n=1 Tax=Glossina pallidipes TaxID=7398 RepID=A0A1A9ZB92_GLOPL
MKYHTAVARNVEDNTTTTSKFRSAFITMINLALARLGRRDIVGSDAGSGSGATRGAKFAKRAASTNNYREAGCNELAERFKWPVTLLKGHSQMNKSRSSYGISQREVTIGVIALSISDVPGFLRGNRLL